MYDWYSNSDDSMYLLKKIEYKINIYSRDSILWTAGDITRLGNNDEGIQSFDESIRLNPIDAMT